MPRMVRCRRSWRRWPGSAQLLMQAALEAEITEFPARDRYPAGCVLRGRPARIAQQVPGGSVCQQIKDEYEKWAKCYLDSFTLDYLFLDAGFFRNASRLSGRAGAGHLGHHHRPETRLCRPSPWIAQGIATIIDIIRG